MAIIKCKMCGGDIELSADKTYGTCDSCGSTMTFPKIDDEHRANLFNRANHFRRQNEFDKAVSAYERILDQDDTDAEAHWGVVLSRFGIEYVEDPVTHERIPTCHRVQAASILTDGDYLAAIEHAPDGYSRSLYEAEAKRIAEIQKGILAISAQEKPYDVFICYKESTDGGSRTKDSTIAQDIYYQLKQEGFKVFFSRITLEDKLGQQYEPYIFAALNSAKVMLVVGTRPEYFNAVWVKNEWSRYLALMKEDRSRLLIPCYRDMDAYDLPDELSTLQSQDMSKIGFMQDLIRGVKKVLTASKPQQTQQVAVSAAPVNAVAPLLRRAFMFLEDGDWAKADEFCEQVLNMEPENAEAYLGKMLAALQVDKKENLANYPEPFDDEPNYLKAMRFGDAQLKADLQGYIHYINERNENARLEAAYQNACGKMDRYSCSENDYKLTARLFESLGTYKDSAAKVHQCLELAEVARKDQIYYTAKDYMTHNAETFCLKAIELLQSISGWRDADELIPECHQKIQQLETERRARERSARKARLEQERKARKRKRMIIILSAVAVVVVAVACIINFVIIPNQKYDAAVALMNAGKYDEAIIGFTMLDGYKDSYSQINACKYNAAVVLMNEGKYVDAHNAFIALNGHKDSAAKADSIFDKAFYERYSNSIVGDYVTFGHYEQDATSANGKEPIEWQVLAKENNRLLVISRYALNYKPYNEKPLEDVTWETCTLRKWLNNDFLNAAFSTTEQAMIPTVTVSADENPDYSTNPGNATQDKVFLLSIPEAEKYFTSDSARKCMPTVLAANQGGYNDGYSIPWWLRTPGRDLQEATTVHSDGFIVEWGAELYGYGWSSNLWRNAVRPALWINLEP